MDHPANEGCALGNNYVAADYDRRPQSRLELVASTIVPGVQALV
jgi:hypothetical protein